MRRRKLRRHFEGNQRVRIVYSPGFEWVLGEKWEVETRSRFIRRCFIDGILIR